MRVFRSLALAFTLAVVPGAIHSAAADPVTITSGTLFVSGVPDVNSRGFRRAIGYDFVTDEFRLRWFEGDGSRQDPLNPFLPHVAEWTPTGASAAQLVFVEQGLLRVTATPSTSPTPFLLSGRIELVDMDSGETLFDDIVSGAGIATWSFIPPADGTLVWQVMYEFGDTAPVPEPATLLLVGAGLAGALARRRKRTTAPDEASPDGGRRGASV